MALNPKAWLDTARTFDRLVNMEADHRKLNEKLAGEVQDMKDRLTKLSRLWWADQRIGPTDRQYDTPSDQGWCSVVIINMGPGPHYACGHVRSRYRRHFFLFRMTCSGRRVTMWIGMGIDCKRPWLRHDRFLRRARRDHEIAEKRSRLRRGKQRSDPDREATESWRSLKLGDLSAKAQANPNPIPRRRLSEWTDRQGARPTITDPGREGMLDPLAEPRIFA
jgi:hypothetical protein